MKKCIQGFISGILITIILSVLITSYADSWTQTIEAVFNKVNITVNSKPIVADNILYNGTTYVPIRAVSEALGKDVGWNGDTNTASINDKIVITPKPTPTAIPKPTPTPTLSAEKIYEQEHIRIYKSGKYDGDLINDIPDGYGTMTWNTGGTHIGYWKNGIRTGYGVCTYPNGDRYIGEFKNDQRNGQGTYYYIDGSVLSGSWLNGDYVSTPKPTPIPTPAPNYAAYESQLTLLNTTYNYGISIVEKNATNDIQRLKEGLNARGILNSSICTDGINEINDQLEADKTLLKAAYDADLFNLKRKYNIP